jgi:RHS repeat-associated protein
MKLQSTLLSNHSISYSTTVFCISALFILHPFIGQTQLQGKGEPAVCNVKVNDKTVELKLNNDGSFQRLSNLTRNAVIPVEIIYPAGTEGERVVASVLDGGRIDGTEVIKIITLTRENKCAFVLNLNDNLGLFRVLLVKGDDQKVVQVWVDSGTPSPNRTACACGNGNIGGCKECGVNHFNPYTGNVNRTIRDLEVWGGVGEIPLVAMRYGKSRSIPRNWQLNFHYLLFDAGVNASGQAQIDLHYPDREEVNTFTQSVADPSKWLPLARVDKRIFQYGPNYFLQLSNGQRYRFERVVSAGIVNFFLRDFFDQYKNLYTVSYDNVNLKKRITEPAGRYIEYTFTPRSFISDPVSVVTNDGRSAQLVYDQVNDGIRTHDRLRTVNYGDGTQALYTYSQLAPGLSFSLEHAIDPRLEGTATDMKYTYTNLGTGIAGLVHEELNGVTGQVMATLDGGTDDRKVLYANGRMEILNMPEAQMGAVNKHTDGVGAITQYTYDNGGIGFLTSLTDALGRTTTYNTRTIYGNPLEITHPDGCKEKWTRDTLDLVLTYTDALNRVTKYTRDTRHRPTRIDYPDGTFETFTYNNFSEVLTHQEKNGTTEQFAYDARGLKTSYTDCLGNVTNYTYDAADRLATVMDARGNVTKYEYNERGLLTKMTNADNSLQTYTYDAFGNRLTTTNELSKTWTTSYDEFKRPKTIKDPLNRTTTYSYDLPGAVCGCSHSKNTPTKITLPSGKMVTMTYDVEWRKLSETNGASSADVATTTYQYDLKGNLVKTVDGRGKQWTMTYDARDRKKTSADPVGNITTWTYDCESNITSVKRPDNGTTSYVYDNMNRLTQTTDPKAQITKMTYDADGNMTKLTDPKNNDYNFEYDCLDRKTKMIYPGGSLEQYTYDPASNLKTYRNRNGDIRTYTYDNRNRETLSDWSDATPDVSTTYDALSRTITKTSSVSTLSYSYNDANEMLTETQSITGASGPKTITYAYNSDGLRNTVTYPAGTIITYGYTGRNQVLTITADAPPPVVTYTYDLNGNRVNKVLKNGTNNVYTYDDANRVLSIDHLKAGVSFARFNYGYDNVNRRKFVQYDNAKGDVYTYDAIDQVTDVKYDVTNPDGVPGAATRTVNYGLDASGNRTLLTDNAVPTNYTTNILNQYSAVGANAATYNTNGNLQTFDGWTYTYDAQNRMTKAQKAATTIDFVYDARNRCVKRTISATVTYFYFDDWSLIDERNAADVQLARYVHGVVIDEILVKLSPANTVYYHHDALGSTMRLTDITGNIVEKYSYDVFGAPTMKDGAGITIATSAFSNRFSFTGREYVQEVGLYDYRNRMYHQVLGRFLQTDPILFAAGDYNLYRYVVNNVSNYNDPLGLIAPAPFHPQQNNPPCAVKEDVGNMKYKSGVVANPASATINFKWWCCDCLDGINYTWEFKGFVAHPTSLDTYRADMHWLVQQATQTCKD